VEQEHQMNGQEERTGFEIAVIGMSGRFPGARNIDEFWENLKNGKECFTPITDEELEEAGVPLQFRDDPNYVKTKGGVLEGREHFDAAFFDYTPVEAEIMDPQLRVFLETAWNALEHAAYDPFTYEGLIGLYAGAGSNFDWEALAMVTGKSGEYGSFASTQLIDRGYIATRVSYRLNLRGPAVAVQTACSTSLVAVHMAARAILSGECDIALAGGVSIKTSGKKGYMYTEGMILSPDGHCRAFDADAAGTVSGEGTAAVVLKALEDAEQDGDYIHAVIKSTAINNDGERKVGFTTPSVDGQADVIRAAHIMAEVQPRSIGYVEAHGTATTLGDPVEIEALRVAFNAGENPDNQDQKKYCAVGSVKSNIGHLDRAAGIAGLIKTVLILKHRQIPPSLHFKTPNPRIDFARSPFYVNARLIPWERNGGPLRAGVSAFGLGGTNAHAVLEEPPAPAASTGNRDKHRIIMLSAKTRTALKTITDNLVNHLQDSKENGGTGSGRSEPQNLADVAYTLQVGRHSLIYRRMAVCNTVEELLEALKNPEEGKTQTAQVKKDNPPVVFMFSGQGSQYVNMGRDLYRTEPVFRDEMNRSFAILEKLGCPIKQFLYPGEDGTAAIDEEEAKEKINDVLYSGPVKFAVENAMAKQLISWGIKPYALIGHSFGEYAAAHRAGVFTLEDALAMVVLRGRLMEKTAPGAMMSVPLSEEEIEKLRREPENKELSLAALNTPNLCIVSGPEDVVQRLRERLTVDGHECLKINFPRASHSRLMIPIQEELKKAMAGIRLNKPGIPYVSGVSGNWITAEQATDPEYWARHMVETVRYIDGLSVILQEQGCLFVQMGSDRGLPLFLSQHPDVENSGGTLNLLRHPKDKIHDRQYLHTSLGQLWLHGVEPDWKAYYADETRRRLPLPTYPFEGKRYWIDGDPYRIGARMMGQAQYERKTDRTQWYYVPAWTRAPLPQQFENRDEKNIVLYIDESGVGERLLRRFEEAGKYVTVIESGNEYCNRSSNHIEIDGGNQEHYEKVLEELKHQGRTPHRIIHLWTLDGHRDEDTEHRLNRGFYSLYYLARALGARGITEPLDIDVVTRNMQEVNGLEELDTLSATVLGPVKVIPVEYPNIKCRSIDIGDTLPGTTGEETGLRQLWQELQANHTETPVAFRGRYRWEQTFKPVPLGNAPKRHPRLKEKGVYLVTGGMGGIGQAIANYLAETVKARLVLTGRSQQPKTPEQRQNIERWEKLGAEVLQVKADAANAAEMENALAQAGKRFGTIDGVIHAAGLPDGAVIQGRTREMTENIMAPKVGGTLILDRLFADRPLDFMVLCSSVNAIIPTMGQLAHCAANAFMDAFAAKKDIGGRTGIISINWNSWLEVGQAAEALKKLARDRNATLSDGLTTAEGIDVLLDILAGEHARVIVSTVDFLHRVKRFEEEKESRRKEEFAETEEETENENLQQRPPVSTSYHPPGNQTEKHLTHIWQRYFGYEKIGIRDDFFELGGDSLKAMAVIAGIHRELNVRIAIPVFFANPTIADLAAYIENDGKEAKTEYNTVVPVEKRDHYPLSSAQKRLYLIQQMDPGNTSYNITQAVILELPVKEEALDQTFQALIRRHESLRTSFETVDGEPMQRIRESVDFRIETYDLTETTLTPRTNQQEEPTKEGYREVDEIIRQFIRPFDLSGAPQLRVGLIKLAEEKYVLLVDMHHIISDGVSQDILLDDFIGLDRGETLQPLPYQYKDVTEWLNSNYGPGTDLHKKQEEYWLKQFETEIPQLTLPTDYPRPQKQAFDGKELGYNMAPERFRQLKESCTRHDVTLYQMMLTIYNILLYKLSGQEDLVVGTSLAGRGHEGMDRIIGMFLNNLALRNYPKGQDTFDNFLQDVKQRTLEAFDNQYYPLDQLAEKVVTKRIPGRSPIFDAMFVLNYQPDNRQPENEAIDNQDRQQQPNPVRPYTYGKTSAQFDLKLRAVEKKNTLWLQFEYRTDLFKEETAEIFLKNLDHVAATVIENPGIPLEDITLDIDSRLMDAEQEAPEMDFGF
jgi:acyl transferase domain-containing protein/acyl carrier protein